MFFEILLILLSLLLLYDHIKRWRFELIMQPIPIISRVPFIGSIMALSKFQPENMHLKFEEYNKRFGKSFYAIVFNEKFMVTSDARYVDAILSSNNKKHLYKHKLYHTLGRWLGKGLLLSVNEQWQTMRKIITPTFHFKILTQFVNVFDRQTDIMIEKLHKFSDGKTVVDIYPYMALLTLDIIAETAMGLSINAQINSKSDFVLAVKNVTNIVATLLVRPHLFIPGVFRLTGMEKTMTEGIAIMHKFTEDIIQERRKQLQLEIITTNANTEDQDIGIKKQMALLDVLLQGTVDGRPLSDKQIRDEVNTFMFEGHDTTTTATSFCLYLISRHADAQQKLFEEIRSHFGDNLQRPITYNDLQNLNYLNCVIKESLRIYPPIPAIGRQLMEDLKLPDVTVPAGVNINIIFWTLLRDPEVFPEPERFLPERHLVENPRANAFTNIPFSAGPRNCIGQRFALFEMKTIIIKMLRNYELLAMGDDVQPSIKIVLRSTTGVNFGLKPRLY